MMALDRILKFASIAAVLVLLFLLGGVATYYKYPPYGWIYEAVTGYEAMKEKEKAFKVTKKDTQEGRINRSAIIHKKSAYDGYTLLSYTRDSASLVDMKGNVVHTWKKKFSEIWPDPPHVKRPVPDSRVAWIDAQLYPNGDLLAVLEGIGDTPYGYGLVKLDKDSNIVWKIDDNIHHTFNIGEDGNIYALTHTLSRPKVEGITFADPVIIDEAIVVISPDGKIIDKLPLIEAFMNAGMKDELQKTAAINRKRNWGDNMKGDITHINAVMPLNASRASAFPMFKQGQLLVSVRNMHMIGVVDMQERKFVWTTQGPWRMQHDTEFQADGTITLFDNRGSKKQESRVIQYFPDTKKSVVAFKGGKGFHFYTGVAGMKQLLPNGNWLLVESMKERVIEVDSQGNMVWRITFNKSPTIFYAHRYSSDQLSFLPEPEKNN